MNHFSKLMCVALLGMVSQGAGAYNYWTQSCGQLDFNSGHMTFNYALNLSSAEQNDISIAFSRLTAFSDSSISINITNDTFFVRGNGQNEIYRDTAHGTAQCWVNYNTNNCDVNEADIRFGDETWVTGFDSNHAPYNTTLANGRSIAGTAVHEGGHCLGMAHENALYNMMGEDWSHVTRNGVTTYYGPGEDLSDGLIDLHGERSGGSDTYRDVGATVLRYEFADGAYSDHQFGVLRDASSGTVLPVVGSFAGQDTFEVVAGETVEMELTFENNGEEFTESPNVGFYLSGNSIISANDTLLRTDTGYSLSRGAPYEVTENVTIPSDWPAGNYFLGAFVDHDNLIGETTGGNNVAYYPVSVVRPADLTVPFAGVDDTSVAPNETIKSIAVVRNDGIGPSDATTLRYYRSSNSFISTGDTLIALDSIPILDPGEISSENADTSAPGSEGTWYYGACVAAVSGESNTNNQCSTGTQVTVSWPAPTVTTNVATNIDTTSADLNATFDPFGAPHTVYFDWGETAAYGNTVEYTGPIFAGTISVTLSGLVCNTEYHFRARVVSDGGTTTGGDQQFTTLACPGC